MDYRRTGQASLPGLAGRRLAEAATSRKRAAAERRRDSRRTASFR